MTETIQKALDRLENANPQVIIRGGKIVKIPAQTVELQPRDGIQVIYKINEDII